jgi:hypothetical protein
MRLGTRAIAWLTLAVAACASSGVLDPSDLEGYWVLESFEVEGVDHTVEVLVNTVRIPWIFIGDALEGNGGCNDFNGYQQPPYQVEGDRLIPGEILFELAACLYAGSESVMAADFAMQEALWSSPEGFVVVVDDLEMVWDTGDTRLVFSKADAPPDN